MYAGIARALRCAVFLRQTPEAHVQRDWKQTADRRSLPSFLPNSGFLNLEFFFNALRLRITPTRFAGIGPWNAQGAE